MTPRVYHLVGLTGAPGSGKDSCAEALRRHGYHSIAFADALRSELANAWRVDQRMFTNRATKETPLPALAIAMCMDSDFQQWALEADLDIVEPRSARWLMQRWGTEFRRLQFGVDYWSGVVRKAIESQRGRGAKFHVITDVRFANESELVASLGGKLLGVHRPDAARLAASTASHASETVAERLAVDGVIHNDGSLDALAGEVERVMLEVFGADALPNAREVRA
jgi:hypothetical protein